MSCYAIKTQQIKKETDEYCNYDWNSFANLTFDEKIAEYRRILEIELQRKESWEFYFNKLPQFVFEADRLKRLKRKITYLIILIETLKYVLNRIELEIML